MRYLVLVVVFSLCAALPSFADGRAALVRCPKRPINVKLIRKALAAAVEDSINPEQYSGVRVRVALRLVGREKRSIRTDLSDILAGLSLSTTNLVPLASGTIEFNPTCEFDYVARVRIRGTDVVSGAQLSALQEIPITVRSSGDSRGRIVE